MQLAAQDQMQECEAYGQIQQQRLAAPDMAVSAINPASGCAVPRRRRAAASAASLERASTGWGTPRLSVVHRSTA